MGGQLKQEVFLLFQYVIPGSDHPKMDAISTISGGTWEAVTNLKATRKTGAASALQKECFCAQKSALTSE